MPNMPKLTAAAQVAPAANVRLRKKPSCSMGLELRRSTRTKATEGDDGDGEQGQDDGDVQP